MTYPHLSEQASFTVVSDRLQVSDPCYSGDKTIYDVKPGAWKAAVQYSDEADWGIRVAQLIATHSDYKLEVMNVLDGELEWEYIGSVGVDSGQMSITDCGILSGQDGHQDWYDKVCDITLAKPQWGTLHNGVVSSSGYGDGGYEVWAARDRQDKVISVAVVFIDLDEDDLDEDDPDNDEPLETRRDIDLEEEELE